MARRSDTPRRLTARAVRPPLVREFSAGGLVYRQRADEIVLLLAARRHPQSGALAWTIPKGHVEPGESTEAAAVREVREETGIEAVVETALGDVTYWYARRDEHGEPLRVFKRVRFFLMRALGGRFRDRDHEMDAVRWFAFDAAETLAAYDNERTLVRRAHALLAPPATT